MLIEIDYKECFKNFIDWICVYCSNDEYKNTYKISDKLKDFLYESNISARCDSFSENIIENNFDDLLQYLRRVCFLVPPHVAYHRFMYFKKMNYQDYLQTHYWKVFSTYRKLDVFECQLCRTSKIETNLQVHHTSYSHKGFEFIFEKDTIVLCAECHKRHHGVK